MRDTISTTWRMNGRESTDYELMLADRGNEIQKDHVFTLTRTDPAHIMQATAAH